MLCPRSRSGNCPRCRDTSTPCKPLGSVIHAAGTGPWDRGTEPSCCCLLRLGLRAGDIASMRPADIDWQEATLLVRGKGRRDVRLPLPQDAGDAALEYLEHERPRVTIDRIFLCANAPLRALRSGGAVSNIVEGALRAAGIED